MKISYNWLNDFTDLSIDAHELAERLTMVGFEVDGVAERGLNIPGVVIGKVLAREAHPNADKLSLCTVDVGGGEPLQIICGAPNVAAGQTVAVATVGAELPVGLKIRKAKIRGVESAGMICSEEELGLADKSEGIWVLEDGLAVGEPLAKALNFETDWILDLAVTPNRPDALSHIGIAREAAAILDKPLHLPRPDFPEAGAPVEQHVAVEILCPEGCPRYAARLIRGLTVQPSPEWMVRRLEAVGVRSINNLVDATNYVLMETGHPLHAFDFRFIAGGKIIVRESREGEKFITLDEKEHILKAGTVLICDAEKPVALGGIMGGLNSEVVDDTTEVLLESAYFTPEYIQKSVRCLGISSEASQRFERGADPNGVLYAQARATQLMLELGGGEVCKGVVDAYPSPIHPVEIDLKVEQINKLLGTQLTREQMAEELQRIGLLVDGPRVTVPTFRPDIRMSADLAEEVGRLYGYDNIPTAVSAPFPYLAKTNPMDDFIDELRNLVCGIGYREVVTNSMINRAKWEGWSAESIYPILNPISQDMNGMRNSLIPALLGVLQWNINRQISDLAVFEIGRIFKHPGSLDKQPVEQMKLGVALTGKREKDLWASQWQSYDFYDIKGFVERLADKFSLDNLEFIDYDNFAVANQALGIKTGHRSLGYIGKVRDELLKAFEIESPVFVAELDVTTLFEVRSTEQLYQPIPRYPRVERDLAVVVDETLPVGGLMNTIGKNGGRFLTRMDVFDVYRGKQVASGKKSVAFRLHFQSPEKTLTEEEVNQATGKILKALQKEYDAQLRT